MLAWPRQLGGYHSLVAVLLFSISNKVFRGKLARRCYFAVSACRPALNVCCETISKLIYLCPHF